MSGTRRSRPSKTTIVDIAACTGVSVTTVSRVLNGKPDVSDMTRMRVLRAMEELGFAPQNAWRQIRSGRSGLIGVHAPQEFNPPNLQLMLSAALEVEEAGYSINIITRGLDDAELLGIFRGREVDGILLLEILADDRRPKLLSEHGYPFVMVGHRSENARLSYVDVDVAAGIEAATIHLYELGHRDIGLLTFQPIVDGKRYAFAGWAMFGYQRACLRYGLVPIAAFGGVSSEEMAAAAGRLLDDHPEVTAVLAPQDLSAIGVLRAAQARGMHVPTDLSVIAMLGDTLSEIATPPLTTISFPADEMGTHAARMLLKKLVGGQDEPEQMLIKPILAVRGSTAPPRGVRT